MDKNAHIKEIEDKILNAKLTGKPFKDIYKLQHQLDKLLSTKKKSNEN